MEIAKRKGEKKVTHISEPFLQLLLISPSQGPVSVDEWSQFLLSSHRCPTEQPPE